MGAGAAWGKAGAAAGLGGYVGVGYPGIMWCWAVAWAGEEAEEEDGGRWR